MKAIRIHNHGGPEVLQIDDLPMPEPKVGEVRVRVLASALNHMDLWVRRGIPGVPPLPLVLGCDAAGTIDKLGEGVNSLTTGTRVVLFPLSGCGKCPACLRQDINLCKNFKIPGEHEDGTHREYFCVAVDRVFEIPNSLDFTTAAAFPLAALTAWHMVMTNGQTESGKTVLVVAAASGVGSFAVQIAKLKGARVIAIAGGAEKCAQAKSLGADETIDYKSEKISKRVKELTAGQGADLIIESVGVALWDELLRSLAWGGKLVTCGATSGPNVSLDLRHIFIKQQSIIGSTMGTPGEFKEILAQVANGKIKPVVAKTFAYHEIKAAHEFLEDSKQFGKVVLAWE